MRQITILTTLVILIAAVTSIAADIPDRPEKLKYPEFTFDIPDADSLRFELEDGTPVYAKQDTQLPLVNIAVYFRGGRYLVPEGKEGLAGITGAAWRTGGAGERTAQELDEELDFLAASLGTTVGDVWGSVSLNVLSKDLEAAMGIFMDVLTAPRFQQDRFDKAKENALQAMKQRNDDTSDIEARVWSRLIYGEDYWKNRLATQASVDSITAGDSKTLVQSLVRSGNLVIAVAGDFEPDALKSLLNKTVGSLEPLAEPLPPIPQPDHVPQPGVYVVNNVDVNQGRVSIGRLGFRQGFQDQFPLMVGNDILGGGGFTARMMKRIRSDEGLAYGAYASLGFQVTYPGTFRAFYQSKSSTCAYAAEIFFKLLDDMRKSNATDEEIKTTKASLIETFPNQFASAAQVVGLYANDEVLGRDHSYWVDYRDNVSAVTAEKIQTAMMKNIDPETMIMLVVGNIEEIMEGHPEHAAKLTDFGEIKPIPLRDPMTLEPIVE
jgi:predicted Zn-dependent peptidase